MSTRTRLVFSTLDSIYTGPNAVRMLMRIVKDALKKPDNWKQMPKRERLVLAAKYLPPDYVLQLFQEPRGTRKGKSLYQRVVSEEPARVVKRQNDRRERVYQAQQAMAREQANRAAQAIRQQQAQIPVPRFGYLDDQF